MDELPVDWVRWDDYEPESLLAELHRELPQGHKLYGVPVKPYAALRADDSVAFLHCDEPERITVVHLTWCGCTEINADFPSVEFEGTRQEFFDFYTRQHQESKAHHQLMREKYPHRYQS